MAQANSSLSPHKPIFYLTSGAVTLALYRARQALNRCAASERAETLPPQPLSCHLPLQRLAQLVE
jgi:hypothetical protein